MQNASNDKTLRSNTVQVLKDFNPQSLSTEAERGEKLVSMMPAFQKVFDLMGDDIVELSTENESLKNKIGSYDEKWLDESKAKLLKQIDDEGRANLILCRMEKRMKKQNVIAYTSYDKSWRSAFYNKASTKDKSQDFNLNQLKFKVNGTYKKHEKVTTNFEPSQDEDNINKT